MNNFKKRLKKVVGSNPSKFARELGEHRQTLDCYLAGRLPFFGRFLSKLAVRGVNINWLLTGKGRREAETEG